MAANQFDILASATQTASGSGGSIDVPTGTMLEVSADVTAQTAISAFSLWLETSDDGGVTWYEMPFDQTIKNAGSVAAEGTDRQNKRNIVNNESTSAVVAKYTAIYKHLAAALIRIRWFFTGTNITFKVRGAVK